MRDFWVLFKISTINNFGINKLQKKFSGRSHLRRIFMILLAILLGLGLFALILFYFFMFAQMFVVAEQLENILLLGIVIGSLIVFITTLSKANAYLFESKDYDLLMSLPVKPQSVVSSKLAGLLFLNYVMLAFIFLPAIIVYGFYARPSIDVYFLSLLVYLVAPLLLVTICSVIAYFMGLLLARVKYKNVFQTIGLLVFFVVLMFFIMQSSMTMPENEDELEALIEMVTNMSRTFEIIYYPGVWARDGILGHVGSLILYIAISVIPFILFIFLVGKEFAPANARARIAYTDTKFRLSESQAQSQIQALFKKEVRRYFSSSMVVLNTIVGPIMGTIIVLIMLFSPLDFNELGLAGFDAALFVAILLAISTFMNGMITTTATSISLEGKYFWILKSAPIKEEDVFVSKILLNLAITLPFTIVNTIAIAIVIPCGLREIVMLLFIPIMVNLVIGTIGLYINLLLPRMDWVQEVKVVKQSLSVIVAMLVGMGLVIGMFAVFFLLLAVGITFAYLILSLILIVLLGGAILLLLTDGKKRYNQIKA